MLKEKAPVVPEKVFSSLSSPDALKIFELCETGIYSSTDAIKELGLTQKRYYIRLGKLIDAGLVGKKKDGVYGLTILGRMCRGWGKALTNALSQGDRLELADTMMKSRSLSTREKEDILYAISGESLFEDGLATYISPMHMIDTYENLVQETISLLERGEGEVYLATQYFDMRVVEAILRGVKRGVKFSFLYDLRDSTTERLSLALRMMFSPKSIKFFYDWLSSPDLRVRLVDLPYTFIVVNSEYAMIELQKPSVNTFSLAFTFKSPSFCRKLMETFNFLWNKGSEPSQSLMNKLLKRG